MQDLPDGVGPHEGREFDLMRRGTKHVAMFEAGYEPDGLADLLATGQFASFTDSRTFNGITFAVLFVHRIGYEDAAHTLREITRSPPRGFQPAHERQVGHILGYTDAEIDAFIAHCAGAPRP